MGTTIALDIGSKRVGVAILDPGGTYALPLKALIVEKGKIESQIISLLKERAAELLVLGLPRTINGEATPHSKKIERLARRLNIKYPIKISFVDEYLSTEEARQELAGSKALRPGVVDSKVACIILENYLTLQDVIQKKSNRN